MHTPLEVTCIDTISETIKRSVLVFIKHKIEIIALMAAKKGDG